MLCSGEQPPFPVVDQRHRVLWEGREVGGVLGPLLDPFAVLDSSHESRVFTDDDRAFWSSNL